MKRDIRTVLITLAALFALSHPFIFIWFGGAIWFYYSFWRDGGSEERHKNKFIMAAIMLFLWPLFFFCPVIWPFLYKDTVGQLLGKKSISFQWPIKIAHRPLTPEENALL